MNPIAEPEEFPTQALGAVKPDTELDEETRLIFEPKYGRQLSDQEIWEIRFNLTNYFLTLMEFKKKAQGGIDDKLSSKSKSEGGNDH